MKKKELEIMLQSLASYRNPKPVWEQYMTPANVAAHILFMADQLGDIKSATVADLGAGTGIFTIGACILGAEKVIAVEIDPEAVDVLEENLSRFNCSDVEIRNMNVENFSQRVDTVFQNPPFGSQSRHADLPFLKKALEVGRVIYTLHNAVTEKFLRRRIEEWGGRITHRLRYKFFIPRIYHFHRRERVEREFVMFRIVKVIKN